MAPILTRLGQSFGFGASTGVSAAPFEAKIIMTGGGGGGGTGQGSGGGGGGAVGFFPYDIILGTPYTFYVGKGGPDSGPGSNDSGTDGENSGWESWAFGGGGYGAYPPSNGGDGNPHSGNGGGGGSGNPTGGGAGGPIISPQSPFTTNSYAGGAGHPGPGGSGGNQGGGGGGASQAGQNALGPGTPGTRGGGHGGNGQSVPEDYLPASFIGTGSVGKASNPTQFLGVSITAPTNERRYFGAGGGGGAEHGVWANAQGGVGGGGHGGYGSPTHPYPLGPTNTPPRGPSIADWEGPGAPASGIWRGEPGFDGRGGGGGGGGIHPSWTWGGRGGAGVLIIKAPLAVTATFAIPGPQAPYATNYAHGSHRYFIVQGEGGTNPVPGTVVFS